MRVVVAEDSVLFREGLTRLLSEDGHEIVAAVGDANALLAAVRADRPDLIVVDVRMPPQMTDDGARVARQLRAEHPTLPILLLSQHIVTQHAVELVSTGAFGSGPRRTAMVMPPSASCGSKATAWQARPLSQPTVQSL